MFRVIFAEFLRLSRLFLVMETTAANFRRAKFDRAFTVQDDVPSCSRRAGNAQLDDPHEGTAEIFAKSRR